MAARQRYYPSQEPAQVGWLTNYRNQIGTHGPGCGIVMPEVLNTKADLDYFIFLLHEWHPSLQNAVKSGTNYKTLVATGSGETVPLPGPAALTPPTARPPGVLNRLFNQVGRIKLSTGYTETIGADLGIIGAEDTTEHPFPEFSLTVQQGMAHQIVRIDFTKFGHTGVYIESRRGTGSWEFLGIDTAKPYLDERPLLAAPAIETRDYRLRWWDDEPNGDWSPIQKATVGP